MIDHLIDRALHALHVEREQSEDDETEMADGRVGNQLFNIALHHRHHRAVDNTDDGERDDVGRRRQRRVWKKWNGKAQKAVGAELQENTGEDHRTRRRRFHVGIGQPGVEWKQRNFDREGQRKGEKQPHLLLGRQVQFVKLEQVKRHHLVHFSMARGEIDDRHQHEQATGHGEDDKLERGINAPRAAPHADEKIHRHQHHFPKNVEEKKIERDEGAEHAGFQKQHEDQIFFDFVLHRP